MAPKSSFAPARSLWIGLGLCLLLAVSSAAGESEVSQLRAELDRHRVRIVQMLSVVRAGDQTPLSEDPEFRAVADRVVEIELRLEALAEDEAEEKAASDSQGQDP